MSIILDPRESPNMPSPPVELVANAPGSEANAEQVRGWLREFCKYRGLNLPIDGINLIGWELYHSRGNVRNALMEHCNSSERQADVVAGDIMELIQHIAKIRNANAKTPSTHNVSPSQSYGYSNALACIFIALCVVVTICYVVSSFGGRSVGHNVSGNRLVLSSVSWAPSNVSTEFTWEQARTFVNTNLTEAFVRLLL
ncbi:hypothetical protein F5B20DRAFT_585358 [Whalleya microplaca]|nr:hypothetical protein F5B20DRAFT_585358 [Whalleya microplaca]